MKKLLLAIVLVSLGASQGAVLSGALRINSDATGTNTKSSAITISAQTNLLAGSLTLSNLTANKFLVGGANGLLTSATNTGTGSVVADQAPTITAPVISGHATIEGVTPTGATGTGKFVFDGSPTIVTPTIASLVNATHTHQNAAGGGTLDAAAVAAGTIATARLGSGTANTTTFLRGDQSFAQPVENSLNLADNTTNNVSTSKHGFAPKGDNNAAHYLDGTGAYSTPTGGGSGDNTFVNTTATGDLDLTDSSQIKWFLNTTPSPDQATGQLAITLVSTNNQEWFNRTYYDGSSTNITLDARISQHFLRIGTNFRFSFSNKTTDTNLVQPRICLTVTNSAATSIQATNVSDTLLAFGNWGVLPPGVSHLFMAWNGEILEITQDTAQLDATQIGPNAVVSNAEFEFLDGVTSAIQTQLNAKAPLASPALTGNPTVPTASAGDNDTSAASTAFVQGEMVKRQTFSNAGATVTAGNDVIEQTGTMSASRTLTLAAANSYMAGKRIWIADVSGTVTSANTIVVARAGSDTINGSATSFTISVAYGFVVLESDGTSKYTVVSGHPGLTIAAGKTATINNTVTIAATDAAALTFQGTDTYVGRATTDTLTNKRITARITTITSSATPTVNTDNADCVTITALAAAITSMTTNLSGTPNNFDQLEFRIKDDGTSRAITWGASFVAGPTALPTTTVISKALHVYFEYDSVQAKWVCMSSGSDA